MPAKPFVTMGNVVAEVLLALNDEQNKRYEVKATQWALNAIRRIHVNYSPYYKEVRKYFDNEDLYTIDYPNDAVRILSVGVYKDDSFWSFTKRPNMSILSTGASDEYFDQDANEGLDVMRKGYKYGDTSANESYWADDPQNCRIMVRMLKYYTSEQAFIDRTDWLKEKGVIIRYKSTGVDCSADICIPLEAKDLVVQKVVYEFNRRGIPQGYTSAMLQLQQMEVDNLQAEYEALLYEPHHFWEVKDAIYSSLNTSPRR